MNTFLTILGWILLGCLTVPILWLIVQITMALPKPPDNGYPLVRRPKSAVVIPAHNEEVGIIATIESLKGQLLASDRLIVIADNCSDDTAAVAALHGAEVIVRSDPVHRGKGYALACGVRHLRYSPPEVVIFIDADCHVHAGTLDWLSRVCYARNQPTQAAYLMHAKENSSPSKRVAEFAWLVKNLLRPLGASRLGLGCQLSGSGMALPWGLADLAPLANAHIVEDLKLGLDLASVGATPCFCPRALVTSTFAENTEGASIQRTRWEHGHLSLLLSYGPRIVTRALRRGDIKLLMLGVDLCVPPLSLLVMLAAIAAFVGAIGAFASVERLPWVALVALPVFLGGALLLCWYKFARQLFSIREIVHAFRFAASKIPIYIQFIRKREKEWVSSTRDRL